MKKSRIVLFLILGLSLLFIVFIFISSISVLQKKDKVGYGKEKIGIIYIQGIIGGGKVRPSFFTGIIGSESIMEDLKEAREDPSVKAVVIRINSPGGSAAATQEICEEIERLRKKKKIVVASFGDLAASGAYYVATSCDKIVGLPATLTGSIGVMIPLENLKELYDKIGIKFDVIKSGKHKDIGSPVRELTREERQILQGLINDIHQQFVAAVSRGRKIPYNTVKKFSDGRVFTGRQAYKIGLIDKLGNFESAINLAKDLANIKKKPIIIEYGKNVPFDFLFSSSKREFPLENIVSKILRINLGQGNEFKY